MVNEKQGSIFLLLYQLKNKKKHVKINVFFEKSTCHLFIITNGFYECI